MHDELLRDDPELNLGWKHASGGMLFHFRLMEQQPDILASRATTRAYALLIVSSKSSQLVTHMEWYPLSYEPEIPRY